MLVMMTGLPGSGKSTIARALASETGGHVLGKDPIRAALFEPGRVAYTAEQDDFVMELMLETAAHLFAETPDLTIFLDGRAFSRVYQRERVLILAKAMRWPLRVLHCVCSEVVAAKRLQAAPHPAQNRDFNLYLALKRRFEQLREPHLILDTDEPLEACLHQARAYLFL